jgi:predicted nuclease with TOPRIM domain
MKEQLTERLEKLKGEFESGQKMLADLEARQANLQQTLLRISGAIQVLEELLAQESEPGTEVSESTVKPLEKIEVAA